MATEVDYEQQRNARLLENRKRMEALGLLNLSKSLSASASNSRNASKWKQRSSKSSSPSPALTQAPPRRSSRLLGVAQPCYREADTVTELITHRKGLDPRQCQPEIYTNEHEKLLGQCEEDWELFKDGYDANGVRIYDSENGKTCHQCRQKTLGFRTWCSQCESLRGQFCGDCLFMRYGENVMEALKNKSWICPVCRGICNCSNCRLRKGWAPTGSMYRLAVQLNCKSVAHYLITTRREEACIGTGLASSMIPDNGLLCLDNVEADVRAGKVIVVSSTESAEDQSPKEPTLEEDGSLTAEFMFREDETSKTQVEDECVSTVKVEDNVETATKSTKVLRATTIHQKQSKFVKEVDELSAQQTVDVKEEVSSIEMFGHCDDIAKFEDDMRAAKRYDLTRVYGKEMRTVKTNGRKRGRPRKNQPSLEDDIGKNEVKVGSLKRGPQKNCTTSDDPVAVKVFDITSSDAETDTDMEPSKRVRKPLFRTSIAQRLRSKVLHDEEGI